MSHPQYVMPSSARRTSSSPSKSPPVTDKSKSAPSSTSSTTASRHRSTPPTPQPVLRSKMTKKTTASKATLAIEPLDEYLDLNDEPLEDMTYQRQLEWAHTLGLILLSTTKPKSSYLLSQMRKASARPLYWSYRTVEHLNKVCPASLIGTPRPKKDDLTCALQSLTIQQQWRLSGFIDTSESGEDNDASSEPASNLSRSSRSGSEDLQNGNDVINEKMSESGSNKSTTTKSQASKTTNVRLIAKKSPSPPTHDVGDTEKVGAKRNGSKDEVKNPSTKTKIVDDSTKDAPKAKTTDSPTKNVRKSKKTDSQKEQVVAVEETELDDGDAEAEEYEDNADEERDSADAEDQETDGEEGNASEEE